MRFQFLGSFQQCVFFLRWEAFLPRHLRGRCCVQKTNVLSLVMRFCGKLLNTTLSSTNTMKTQKRSVSMWMKMRVGFSMSHASTTDGQHLVLGSRRCLVSARLLKAVWALVPQPCVWSRMTRSKTARVASVPVQRETPCSSWVCLSNRWPSWRARCGLHGGACGHFHHVGSNVQGALVSTYLREARAVLALLSAALRGRNASSVMSNAVCRHRFSLSRGHCLFVIWVQVVLTPVVWKKKARQTWEENSFCHGDQLAPCVWLR